MNRKQIRIIRQWLLLFMFFLFMSGLTAIPIDRELDWLLRLLPSGSLFVTWLDRVVSAYKQVKATHPFLLYGYDWLAFAHFILALLFIGPYRDPVRNIWVIEFGMMACVLIIPFAFIAGSFRGIPPGWQLIDCSFGVFGILPLWRCHKLVRRLQKAAVANADRFSGNPIISLHLNQKTGYEQNV